MGAREARARPVGPDREPPHLAERRLASAEPRFWIPTAEQLAVLAGDFEEIMGMIALGGIERLTARTGRWLQVRPKGANARDRTWLGWCGGLVGGDGAERVLFEDEADGGVLKDVGAVP